MPVCPTNPTRPNSRGNTKTIPTTERRARHHSAATNHLRGPVPPPLTRPASLPPLLPRATSLWGVWGPPIPRYLRLTPRPACVCARVSLTARGVFVCVRACVRASRRRVHLPVRLQRAAPEAPRGPFGRAAPRAAALGVVRRCVARPPPRRHVAPGGEKGGGGGHGAQKGLIGRRSWRDRDRARPNRFPLPPIPRAVVRARAVRTAAPRATDFAIELLSRAAEPTMMDG